MRNILIILFLALSAVTVGFYLAPSHKEVALMQMNDAHFKDALKYYSSLHDKGDNSINVLVPLINLHVHYGEIDQAIAVLEPFLAKHPRSVEGHKKLAALYKASQRFYLYCKELEKLQKLVPSTETLRELTDTYDFLALYPEELHALSRLVKSEHYQSNEEDYVRLATFFRVNHQPAEAIDAILRFVDIRAYDVSIETMHLAVQLVLEAGNEQKALSLAQGYLEQYGKDDGAVALSLLFQQQGKIETAYTLLEPFLQDMDHSPDLLQQVVMLQLARGKYAEVYALLSDQFNKGPIDDVMAVTLVDLAVKYKNYALAEAVIQHIDSLEELPMDDLLRFASEWFQLKRPNIALYMQTHMDEYYLQQNPLLSAVLDIAVHDTPETKAALLSLPRDAISPKHKMMVAAIYVKDGLNKQAFDLLEGMSVTDMLTTFDASQYAQLYLDANESGIAVQKLNEARPDSTPHMQLLIDHALVLLATGEGREKVIDQWLKDHPDNAGAWLSDAYWLASRYHHNALSLKLAKQLYRMYPTPQNQKELIEALLLNRHYAEALGNLESSAGKDPESRTMYLSVMADWIHRVGIQEVPASNRKKLEVFITAMLKHNDMSLNEKRNMAYLLNEAGFRERAEGVLLSIAQNQPFASSGVSELLWFWGEHPPPDALAWIENRARNALGIEKAHWLSYLNALNYPNRVLAILEKGYEPSPAITKEYISALELTHNKKLLNQVLAKEIDRERNAVRLKQLATIARQEDLSTVSEKGWRKVYALNPNDADAERMLGLLAFESNHYTEAGRLLGKYLQHHEGDYRVNYAYGEFLQHRRKKEEAQPYFARAESQLSEIKKKNLGHWIDEAHLLYRNNKLEESVALYKKLLSQYPENKTLRADFAEILIETRQFKEAALVLGSNI